MTATLHLRCPDIKCEGCATAIKRSLGMVEGVRSVEVGVGEKSVTVQYDDTQVSDATLRAGLTQAGFPPQ